MIILSWMDLLSFELHAGAKLKEGKEGDKESPVFVSQSRSALNYLAPCNPAQSTIPSRNDSEIRQK